MHVCVWHIIVLCIGCGQLSYSLLLCLVCPGCYGNFSLPLVSWMDKWYTNQCWKTWSDKWIDVNVRWIHSFFHSLSTSWGDHSAGKPTTRTAMVRMCIRHTFTISLTIPLDVLSMVNGITFSCSGPEIMVTSHWSPKHYTTSQPHGVMSWALQLVMN